MTNPNRVSYALAGLGLGLLLGGGAVGQLTYQAAANRCQSDQATALALQERTLREQYQAQINQANAAVATLRVDKQQISQRAAQLEKHIDDVTQRYQPHPGAAPQPLPACVFTGGFVGLYNRAIGAPVPAAGAAAGADRTPRAAATANALLPSGVQQPDILRHISGYGSRCQAIAWPSFISNSPCHSRTLQKWSRTRAWA